MTPGYFFQAEDGIRDRTVTGVQTCALPISGTVEAGSMTVRVPLSALRPDAITAGTGAEPRRQNGASTGRSPRPDDERKSTRLNSSHRTTSYAVFCLKKQKKLDHHPLAIPVPYTHSSIVL